MSHRIIPRAEWGAAPARGRTTVAPSRRQAFVVHYDDARPTTKTGPSVPRSIQQFHQSAARRWSDIGYNFVIDQLGNIFEGRGWDVLGAHAGASGNAVGIGVQVHIGGNQQPSTAALSALQWLYEQANQRFGRKLALKGHRDYMSTSCPGEPLYALVRRGYIQRGPVSEAPAPTTNRPEQGETTPSPEEDDMASIESISDAAADKIGRAVAKHLAEATVHAAVESVSDSAANKLARTQATVSFGGEKVGEAIIEIAANTRPEGDPR